MTTMSIVWRSYNDCKRKMKDPQMHSSLTFVASTSTSFLDYLSHLITIDSIESCTVKDTLISSDGVF